ncbi:phage tail protein [Myxococcus stipitatus]|uniref:phage tail protein n=1 Tax=Myxococcus stipitatus TaxID=83455 RepID=UPI001F381204|nr:phage tail protein [Myxococcus stipitatus]MCE9672840.1 phage tail protein [Myxococcus stipitatus]
MATDFPKLLFQYLPGLYRDKDTLGELQRFLEIMALPLEELEASVAQLHEDFFVTRARAELVPLIGALVGVEVDTSLPPRAQREQVSEAVRFYRSKGTQESLDRWAERLTQWRVTLVDFSRSVAQLPFVDALNPVTFLLDQPVTEAPAGSGHFVLGASPPRAQPLFDALTGRPITRLALAGHESEYAGVEGRFTLEERGVDLFRPPEGTTPRVARAADLTDFAQPRDVDGTTLVLSSHQVAVDPVLGRFKFAPPLPLAGNLRATFHALTPAAIATQAFHVGDPSRMRRLGRADDPAPYTVDLRAPRHARERVGQQHFDNHGFFVTPCRVLDDQRPNAVPVGASSGRFTFDNRPLTLGDDAGVALQLLDGLDGSPLTRAKLASLGQQRYVNQPWGFTLRVAGTVITDLAVTPAVRVVAANLSDFDQPRTVTGAPLSLASRDVAVDPQLGRFILDLTALGIQASDLRVDYLLGTATRVEDAVARVLDADSGVFTFSGDGAPVTLRDGFDGTPIDMALRLGRSPDDYHRAPRGWDIRRQGSDVGLLVEVKDLEDISVPVSAGHVAVDPRLGRLKFPSGFLSGNDRITVSYFFEDTAAQAQVFTSLAQRLPAAVPAGTVPVIVDTRSIPARPARLS